MIVEEPANSGIQKKAIEILRRMPIGRALVRFAYANRLSLDIGPDKSGSLAENPRSLAFVTGVNILDQIFTHEREAGRRLEWAGLDPRQFIPATPGGDRVRTSHYEKGEKFEAAAHQGTVCDLQQLLTAQLQKIIEEDRPKEPTLAERFLEECGAAGINFEPGIRDDAWVKNLRPPNPILEL